jgi:hypothetical protein
MFDCPTIAALVDYLGGILAASAPRAGKAARRTVPPVAPVPGVAAQSLDLTSLEGLSEDDVQRLFEETLKGGEAQPR